MSAYQVTFFKTLLSSDGHPFKCLQQRIDISDAESSAEAVEAASKAFEAFYGCPWKLRADSIEVMAADVPTANSKRLTATANRLIVAPNERSFQVDLVRLSRNIPTAGCVASRDPCPSTSTQRAAAQIPKAVSVR